jgi:hypothetical protein
MAKLCYLIFYAILIKQDAVRLAIVVNERNSVERIRAL